MVGYSGAVTERLPLETAIARTLPERTCGRAVDNAAKFTWHWPASIAVIEGEPPLYGTVTILVPVRCMNNSAARCVLVAMPLVATLRSPGFAFASAIRSLTDFTATEGWTIRMWGRVATWEIGAKSRTGSNGSCLCSAGALVKDAAIVGRVWPAGAALAAVSVPLTLPAPGRLSTTMVWPRVSLIFCASRRAIRSVEPPALCGTIRRIGRVG